MPQVGIRELKNETSEIIRLVRDEKVEYVITLRGRPVAVILPVEETGPVTITASADFWERMAALGAEIDAKWLSDKSGVELIQEQRR